MFKSVNVFTKGFSLLCLSLLFVLVNINAISAQESTSITTTVSISICGNGVVEGGEVCEMGNLNNLTCKDFGYEYGELSCCLSCDEYDFSNCSNTPEEIEAEVKPAFEEEIVEEDILQEEEKIKEEEVAVLQESSSKTDDDDLVLLANENVLIDDVLSGENNIPENNSLEFEEMIVIQDLASRSPP